MAKFYYLCDIIGDGQTTETAYRPAVADLGVAWAGSIPTDPNTGAPLATSALVIVAARDHSVLRNKPGIDPLPDFPLDGRVNGINTATLNQAKAAMTRRGLNASAIVDGRDGYREMIRAVGRHFDPEFDENSLDVAE